MILPTDEPYIDNAMFGTIDSNKFVFALFGHVSLLPRVTHFDFYIHNN